MGIDLSDKRKGARNGRRNLKSKNPYLELLVELYTFLSRRTSSKFNSLVAKRLIKARRFRSPMSLAALSEHMAGNEELIGCVVGSILDDKRIESICKMTVCALRFSEMARARIVNAGGECITFDQLAMRSPTGSGCILLRSPTKRRETEKHFGPGPGVPHSRTKPYESQPKSKSGRHKEKRRGLLRGA